MAAIIFSGGDELKVIFGAHIAAALVLWIVCPDGSHLATGSHLANGGPLIHRTGYIAHPFGEKKNSHPANVGWHILPCNILHLYAQVVNGN